MGMPIAIEVVDQHITIADLERVFSYFRDVEEQFSTFKPTSEISRINRGEIAIQDASVEVKEVFAIAEKTTLESDGYFNMRKPDGRIDPAGIVKGWAIRNAANLLLKMGFSHFFVDAGGDIQVHGHNADNEPWSIGIREPVNGSPRIVKTVYLGKNEGIATSGTYIRGQHIFNPKDPTQKAISDIVSLTVIGPDVLEADRFATAAFAMGERGVYLIQQRRGLEGYVINAHNIATQTTGFEIYTKKYDETH